MELHCSGQLQSGEVNPKDMSQFSQTAAQSKVRLQEIEEEMKE